jgi:23S rRNA (pseudouridine1915-N3)-methyltransferase
VLSIHLLAVGKLRPAFREAADDYLRRLRPYARMQEHEVREAAKAGNPAAQRREEGRRLEQLIPDDAITVVLSRAGNGWSSPEFATRLGRWRDGSQSLAFLIGGAEGLAQEVVARATAQWSLGPITLPHELARVVVLEQLYRGFSILAGTPYHRGGGKTPDRGHGR